MSWLKSGLIPSVLRSFSAQFLGCLLLVCVLHFFMAGCQVYLAWTLCPLLSPLLKEEGERKKALQAMFICQPTLWETINKREKKATAYYNMHFQKAVSSHAYPYLKPQLKPYCKHVCHDKQLFVPCMFFRVNEFPLSSASLYIYTCSLPSGFSF